MPDGARVGIWAGVVATWALGGYAAVATTKVIGFAESLTHSMIERFGLFTIVVLGEVVIGVVEGLSEVEARTTSVAAAGAAMVSLVEHAEDGRTPEATAWLLGGSVAATLLCVGLASQALNPDEYPGRLLERVPGTLAAGAALAVAAAAVRTAPVVLAAALLAVLFLTWLVLIVQHFAAGAQVEGADEVDATIKP